MQSSPTPPALTLGTRGSPLALAQAEEVRRRLSAAHGIGIDEIAIEVIKTTGDIILDRPLSEVGGKGLFTKEIEQALYDGRIDLAVHSAKDVATQTPDAFELSAFLPREDVRDVFLSLIGKSPDHLPEGAKIGTSSLRRGAQMKRFRPDFRIVQFRGNVQTRLQKLADGVADATLLALAGLNRLEQAHRATLVLDPRQYPPAPAQGAICLENRKGDTKIAEMAKALDDPMTHVTVGAERAFLAVMDGSCRTPIAAYSTLGGGKLTLLGQILSPDGSEAFEDEVSGSIDDAEAIGRSLGEKLLADAGQAFMDRLRGG